MFALCRVDVGRTRQKGLGIGVARRGEDTPARPLLDRPPEIHHQNIIGNALHNAKVMGDEDVGEFKFLLEILQKVQNLRLDRNIKGGYGFISDNQLRTQNERAGDGNTLALTA